MEATATAITEAEKSERPNWDALKGWIKKFLERYYTHWNPTQAFCETKPHVKRETAWVESSKLLRSPQVREAMRETIGDYGATRTRIESEHAEIAMGNDLADFADILNNPDADLAELRAQGVPTKLLRRYKRRRRVQTNNQGGEVVTTDVEIEPYNRQVSLDALQRIKGMDVSAGAQTGGAVVLDIKVITVQAPTLPAKAIESVVQTAEIGLGPHPLLAPQEPDDRPSAPTDATVDIVAHQSAPSEAPTDG